MAAIDMNLYRRIYDTAVMGIRQNVNVYGGQYGQGYAERFYSEFSQGHNPNNGMQAQQNASHLYTFVSQSAGNGQITSQQLGEIIRTYVDRVFAGWQRQNSQPVFNTGMGGFGSSQPSGNIFSAGMTPSMNTSFSPGSFLQDSAPDPVAKPAQTQNTPAPAAVDFSAMTVSDNPLDALPDDLTLGYKDKPLNWGERVTGPRTIEFISRKEMADRDRKFVIHMAEGFDRQYHTDPMNVVRDFFQSAPSNFLAENFVFRIMYNHVEKLDIPTEIFNDVRWHFSSVKAIRPEGPTYSAIMIALDQMQYRPRMIISKYLVSHINRALWLACGDAAHPSNGIRFSEIEDLDELLGPNFRHPILDIPDARHKITNIVDNAILNAMTCASQIMFRDERTNTMQIDDFDVELIRTSPAFPFSMEKVYPSKWAIPSPSDKSCELFKTNMMEHCLKTTTFVRSIRSVIVTNCLIGNVLGALNDKRQRVNGAVAGLLAQYKIGFANRPHRHETICDKYNEPLAGPTTDEAYKAFSDHPMGVINTIGDHFANAEIEYMPVDQSLYAVQFKVPPEEYLAAIDLCDVFNDPDPKNTIYLAKAKVREIKVTN